MTSKSGCAVCDSLPPGDLIELDLLMSDPTRWPSTIWGIFRPPEGGLPPSYRRYGAIQMGNAYLKEQGYEFSKYQLTRHLRYDVPVLDTDPETLVARGLIAAGTPGSLRMGRSEPIDPLAYVKFYNRGITLGIQGLDLLSDRVAKMIAAHETDPVNNEPPSLALIKMLVDAGSKLAMSQASIKAAGKRFEGDDADENDAFRGASDISASMRGTRVRVIDGEQRPVSDEGLADRHRYNERAAQEGGAPIGGR